MVVSIAYGTENGKDYYVQTCCNFDHLGGECACDSYSEVMTRKQARQVAKKLSRMFRVPIERW